MCIYIYMYEYIQWREKTCRLTVRPASPRRDRGLS